MIYNNMKPYDYFTFGARNEYGECVLSPDTQGSIVMSIYLTSQYLQENILYKDCQYLGLTLNANIDDTYVIQYGDKKLKVQYVNGAGKYKQVFLNEYQG